MKKRTLIALLLIVMLPLGLLGWMGWRIMNNEQDLLEHQVRVLINSQLKAVDDSILSHFENLEQDFLRTAPALTRKTKTLRSFVRESSQVRQVIFFDPAGKRVFPPENEILTDSESRFLERTKDIWSNLGVDDSNAQKPLKEEMAVMSSSEKVDKPMVRHGWYVWHSGARLQHIFWLKDSADHLMGFELEPVRLQADLIGRLPYTGGPRDQLGNARIRLMDSRGLIAYQWGQFETNENHVRIALLPLSHPMGSWKLEYFGASPQAYMQLQWINVLAALVVVGLGLFGLAYYLYREHMREVKLAGQQVNFVNQVSHELKTPLTNIRLYAELLDEHLPEADERSEEEDKSRRFLDVIVTESQRLSRLIGNVLNFARSHKDRLVLNTQPGNIDEIIRSTLSVFKQGLTTKGIKIKFLGNAGASVQVDPDFLEQILNNLFSNVEKYGASGELVEISSKQKKDRTFISVRDYGPGIPKREQVRIFQAFYRVNSSIDEGATGTGIGLSIARQLARLHGGDLTLVSKGKGACFQIELETPRMDIS